jgi:hypothetical protein
MFVMMAVMRTIGAALWLKSFFDCVHNQVNRAEHVGQHRVWFYFQMVGLELDGHMAIT